MKNYAKKSLKTSNGITLIALVITIIVLLILAGISISMLSGDNGILQKATDAKQTSERAEAKEQARIDIMAWITDKTANHQDASLDDTKIKAILSDNKSYVKVAGDTSFTTAKGEYEIPYSELYQSSNITPSEPETSIDSSAIILEALRNANYYDDIIHKSNIRISDTSTAKFYDDDDCNNTAYIEYNGAIYKITYTISNSTISDVMLTDIDVNTLGLSGNNITTILHGTVECISTTLNGETVYMFSSNSRKYYYTSTGILVDWENALL